MQGKLILGLIALTAMMPAPAFAAEAAKRQPCSKAEQPQNSQQRQQTQQQQRAKSQECRVPRNIPPVVDPTPYFLL